MKNYRWQLAAKETNVHATLLEVPTLAVEG